MDTIELKEAAYGRGIKVDGSALDELVGIAGFHGFSSDIEGLLANLEGFLSDNDIPTKMTLGLDVVNRSVYRTAQFSSLRVLLFSHLPAGSAST